MKISEAIAKRIKNLLKENNLSAYKLEQKSNVIHTTMNNILNCKNEGVNLKTIMMICKALNISLSEFFDDSIFDFENFDLKD